LLVSKIRVSRTVGLIGAEEGHLRATWRNSGKEITARSARKEAQKAAREADRAEAYAWSIRMGKLWRTSAAVSNHRPLHTWWTWVVGDRVQSLQGPSDLPLDAIRRPRDTPIWKVEASLKCRSCRKGRGAPPVRMIKLTERQETTPYKWVYPGEER
jgi:hypothetical protein